MLCCSLRRSDRQVGSELSGTFEAPRMLKSTMLEQSCAASYIISYGLSVSVMKEHNTASALTVTCGNSPLYHECDLHQP